MKPDVLTALVDLVPEAILLLGALACFALAATRVRTGVRTYQVVSGAALLAAVGSNFAYLKNMPLRAADPGYLAYAGGLVVDRFSVFMTATLIAFSFFTVLLGTLMSARIRTHLGEYHGFVLLATLGAVLLVSTREMITLWIAVELLGVSLVVLAGTVKTSRPGGEAAVKQLVLGMASSATLLYGLAILYGVGGTTDLVEIGKNVTHPSAALVLAMALTVVGLLGKIGVVPYPRLLPDVGQGAPAPVLGLVGSLGVTAVAGLLLRTVFGAFGAVQSNWTALVALVAALTMLYGSVMALRQRSVRRIVTHLAVAQLGAVLMGLLGAQSNSGVSTVMFSLVAGGIATLAAAAAITLVEHSGTADSLHGYRGLSRRSPGVAAVLSLAALSLAGVPPLVGFLARLLSMEAAVLSGWAWLLVVALVATVLGGVAAVRLVRALFADAADEDALPLDEPAPSRAALTVCGVAVIGLTAAVQPLLALAGAGTAAVLPH